MDNGSEDGDDGASGGEEDQVEWEGKRKGGGVAAAAAAASHKHAPFGSQDASSPGSDVHDGSSAVRSGSDSSGGRQSEHGSLMKNFLRKGIGSLLRFAGLSVGGGGETKNGPRKTKSEPGKLCSPESGVVKVKVMRRKSSMGRSSARNGK